MEQTHHSDEILATAPIGKLMLKLAVPSVAAQIINMLYNIVDRIYIGHIPEVGDVASPPLPPLPGRGARPWRPSSWGPGGGWRPSGFWATR